jgi:NAD(P)-dependent dehydrogenase (short-subunit alcohol dehydrogenase family)
MTPTEDPDVLTVDGDLATANRIVSGVLGRFGRIDTLTNNAGVYISKRAIHRAVIPAAPQNWQIWPVAMTSESTGHTTPSRRSDPCRHEMGSRYVICAGVRLHAQWRRSAIRGPHSHREAPRVAGDAFCGGPGTPIQAPG